MTDQDTTDDETVIEGQLPIPGTEDEPDTITRAAAEKLAKKQVNAATRQAQAAMLEALGVDSIDDAAKIIAARKQADLDNMTEAERKLVAADEKLAAAEAREAAAVAKQHAVTVRAAMLEAGALPKYAKKGIALLDVEVGADDETIEAAVASLAADSPELFGETAKPEKKKPAKSTTPPPPNKTPGSDSRLSAGAERYRASREKPQTLGTIR